MGIRAPDRKIIEFILYALSRIKSIRSISEFQEKKSISFASIEWTARTRNKQFYLQ